MAKKKDAKPGANDGDQARESSASAAAHGRAKEPEKIKEIDSEYLSGRRYPYQEAIEEIEDVDLLAATPGEDINWLEDVELLEEEGYPAVFDRYSNSFVLIKHLQSGNSYGIQLKETHTKFPQPELGPWVEGSKTVGTDWHAPVLQGWEPPEH